MAGLVVADLEKHYDTAAGRLPVLEGVSFTLQPGEAMAVVGPSGSGKSTLLSILGTLEPPSAGSVALGDVDPFSLDEDQRAAFRNARVGFVFQDHALLPQCTALENVLIPTLVSPRRDGHEARARALLEAVGLADRLGHRPAALSGGERQRVAVARALILEPDLLLCDEPTGNLDRRSAEVVAEVLFDLHQRRGAVLVLVTHSLELAARLPIRRQIREGRMEPA